MSLDHVCLGIPTCPAHKPPCSGFPEPPTPPLHGMCIPCSTPREDSLSSDTVLHCCRAPHVSLSLLYLGSHSCQPFRLPFHLPLLSPPSLLATTELPCPRCLSWLLSPSCTHSWFWRCCPPNTHTHHFAVPCLPWPLSHHAGPLYGVLFCFSTSRPAQSPTDFLPHHVGQGCEDFLVVPSYVLKASGTEWLKLSHAFLLSQQTPRINVDLGFKFRNLQMYFPH